MRPEDTIARVDSEAGILATLVHHPDFIYYSEDLLPGHFTNEQNRYIYLAICNLVNEGITTIDPYNIIQCLSSSESTKRYAESLSVEQIYGLIESSEYIGRGTVEEYQHLVKAVKNAAFRRDTYIQLKECQGMCLKANQDDDIQQLIYKKLDEVMTEFSTADDVPPFKDVVDKHWEDIKMRQGAGFAGYPFKFSALNEYATIEKSELFIFGAEQKQGKTLTYP